jgi:tetratricopeptide (TPR) repeat protein
MFAILMAKNSSTEETRAVETLQQSQSVGVRLLILLIGLMVCFGGVWSSGREGLAQLLAGYGLMTERLDEADRAVKLNPATPEAHYARAGLLLNKGEFAEAVKEYERATALRADDYALWLELGRAREQAGDVEGALAAFRESARLAPFYAQPRWRLGNTLYRAGRRDEAFAELGRAVASDPKLLPQALDLSWASFGDDPRAIERVLQPQTPAAHLTFARFYLKHGRIAEALAQFRLAGHVTEDERRALLRELLAAHRFAEAYAVWSGAGTSEGAKFSSTETSFINGGFEEPVSLEEPGFGWQLPQGLQGVQAAQDTAAPRSGQRSLQLAWNGNAPSGATFISQLILVEPNSRYQLRFAARTEKILTVGPPQVMVTDAAASADAGPLCKPNTLPQGTVDWQDYSMEFETGSETRAILVSVRREKCGVEPCPIFGRAWLDDFALGRINARAH